MSFFLKGMKMDAEEVLVEVKRIVADYAAVSEKELSGNTHLLTQLYLDSLDLLCILLEIQGRFDISFDEDREKVWHAQGITIMQITNEVLELLKRQETDSEDS